MPRKKSIAKRKVLPDQKYKSVTINKFINHLMVDGKKSIATTIVYSALDIALEKLKKREVNKEEGGDSSSGGKSGGAITSPSNLLDNVLDNIRPHVEVRSRRVGGATYQVPVEVRAERQDALAMRWLIQSARDRNEKGMAQKLVSEIIDALQGRGASVKKREDMHKMARANQAFAHYRW